MVAQGYHTERIVYLTLFPMLSVVVCLMLHQDWLRVRAHKTINVYHVRQHLLQLFLCMLSTATAVDCTGLFGIYPGWLLGLLDGVGGSLLFACMLISGYLLARGLYVLLNADPGKLSYVFIAFATFFAVSHIPLQTVGYELATPSILPLLDSIANCIVGFGTCLVINVVFFRIRRICLESDRAAGCTSKIGPQLTRMGRVIILVNVIICFILVFLLSSTSFHSVFVEVPADGSYKLTFGILSRILVLVITMIWSYHPLCRKPTTVATMTVKHSTRESRSTPSNTKDGEPKDIEPKETAIVEMAAGSPDSEKHEPSREHHILEPAAVSQSQASSYDTLV